MVLGHGHGEKMLFLYSCNPHFVAEETVTCFPRWKENVLTIHVAPFGCQTTEAMDPKKSETPAARMLKTVLANKEPFQKDALPRTVRACAGETGAQTMMGNHTVTGTLSYVYL